MNSVSQNEKPKMKPGLRFKTGEDVRTLRAKLGLNQSDFWGRISVTQSGGSRYESGRNIPRTVQILLHLAYGTETQAHRLLNSLRLQKD